jgi:hypothetical protein
VPRYRCFCLTDDDRVQWGLHVQARNLADATIEAHRACQDHLGTTHSRVEIWKGAQKLHVSPERFVRHPESVRELRGIPSLASSSVRIQDG